MKYREDSRVEKFNKFHQVLIDKIHIWIISIDKFEKYEMQENKLCKFAKEFKHLIGARNIISKLK